MGVFGTAFRSETVNSSGPVGPASSLYDLLSYIGFGSKGKRRVTYKNALNLPAFWNGVDQISSSQGIIPYQVFKRTAGGRQRAYNHPVDRLLSASPDGKDGFLTPFIFKKMTQTSVLLRGNCLWVIKTNGSGVQKLKYICWDDVYDIKKIADANGEKQLVYQTKEGNYLASEVLHFKGFTHNGICGVSVIKHACEQLGIALETQDFSYSLVENKGVRQGVITSAKPVEAAAKKRIVAAAKSAFAEKDPTRLIMLDEGMEYQPITVTPQEAQIIESARFGVEDIARWLNIPPHKIKSLQQSTNNNIEQQSLEYLSDTMQPWVTNFEQELTKKLFTDKEKEILYVKGNMGVILRSDMKSKGEYYSKMVNSGIFTANEAREYEEKDDMAGGEELRIPVNVMTITERKNKYKSNGTE